MIWTIAIPALLTPWWLFWVLRPRVDGRSVPFILARGMPAYMLLVPPAAAFLVWGLAFGAFAYFTRSPSARAPSIVQTAAAEPARLAARNRNPLASAYAHKLCDVMGKKFVTHDDDSVITCVDRRTGQSFIYTVTDYDKWMSNSAMEGRF